MKTILKEKGFPTKIIKELEYPETKTTKDTKVKRFIKEQKCMTKLC